MRRNSKDELFGRILPILALVSLLNITGAALADTILGREVGVTDGDTVQVLDARKTLHKIRLEGIDAPEKKMPFGNRAKELRPRSSLMFSDSDSDGCY